MVGVFTGPAIAWVTLFGVLMLIVGYFAPLPPRRPAPQEHLQQEQPSA